MTINIFLAVFRLEWKNFEVAFITSNLLEKLQNDPRFEKDTSSTQIIASDWEDSTQHEKTEFSSVRSHGFVEVIDRERAPIELCQQRVPSHPRHTTHKHQDGAESITKSRRRKAIVRISSETSCRWEVAISWGQRSWNEHILNATSDQTPPHHHRTTRSRETALNREDTARKSVNVSIASEARCRRELHNDRVTENGAGRQCDIALSESQFEIVSWLKAETKPLSFECHRRWKCCAKSANWEESLEVELIELKERK
jgi:acetyl/propionyl-CoA carboxylase alpha subunit